MMVGFGEVELQPPTVPFQRGVRETRGNVAQQYGFGERTGVGKVGRGFVVAPARFDELFPMLEPVDVREFEIRELRLGEQLRQADVGQQHHACRADEEGAGVGQGFAFN